MKIIEDISDFPMALKGGVVVIGNFDGVHRGHQHVLAQARARATALGLPCLVMTFAPHPRQFFNPKAPPFLLTTVEQKKLLLSSMTLDGYVQLAFDHDFSSQPAEDFVRRILVQAMEAKMIVVGRDFGFGQGKKGNVALLQKMGQEHGFSVEHVDLLTCDQGIPFTSSRIRDVVRAGDMESARDYLTRPLKVTGEVVAGARQGHRLNCPTANIDMKEYVRPLYGVYVVTAACDGITKNPHLGVASIGVRPTVGGHLEQLEVHLFDFSQTIYGRRLEVDFLHFLRPEEKFDSFDILKKHIEQDMRDAKTWGAKNWSAAA